MSKTPKQIRLQILNHLWSNFRRKPEFEEFCIQNDLALALAHASSEGIIETNDDVQIYADDAWDDLLIFLDVEDDGFDNLSEMFRRSPTFFFL